MRPFDRVIVADWSAAGSLSPARPSANAIWLGISDSAGTETRYFRSRASAEGYLTEAVAACQGRLLIGCDFPMGYPEGFAARLTGVPSARAVWDWLGRHLSDAPDNRNTRFETAARINDHLGGAGPFWGRPRSLPLPNLPETKAVDYPALGLAERRQVETLVSRAQPVWKLHTTGAAGGQGLVGQPMIHRLSARPGVAVWPFDPADAPVVLAEVYPSLLARAVAADPAPIKDEAQVRLLSRALWRLSQSGQLTPLLATTGGAITTEEGWILGAGHGPALEAAAG
jgi:molybdopterin-guanine dinucleotide biosynthesis protein B